MNRIKVFIVEDDMITARDISQRLEAEGCEVVGMVGDAYRAIELIPKLKPDIALLDIGLGKGKMDGIELAGRISEIHQMPIIFMTAYADQTTVNRAMQIMPASYLLKPINNKQLMVSINLAISRFSLKQSGVATLSEHDQKCAESDHFIFNDSIFIRRKERFFKNEVTCILWIEADGNYSNIITLTDRFTILSSIGIFLQRLEKTAPFIARVHRSFAINTAHIDSFDNICVVVKGKEIPLSKSYRNAFFQQIGYK